MFAEKEEIDAGDVSVISDGSITDKRRRFSQSSQRYKLNTFNFCPFRAKYIKRQNGTGECENQPHVSFNCIYEQLGSLREGLLMFKSEQKLEGMVL